MRSQTPSAGSLSGQINAFSKRTVINACVASVLEDNRVDLMAMVAINGLSASDIREVAAKAESLCKKMPGIDSALMSERIKDTIRSALPDIELTMSRIKKRE